MQTSLYDDTIQQRFERFHAENPAVYAELVRRARALRKRGVRRYSIRGLFEAMRYDQTVGTLSADYKLNNDFTALYARKIERTEPGLRGLFATRTRRTA